MSCSLAVGPGRTRSAPVVIEDGKFGIFIHWGPYCVPAFNNEWYPRNMYLQESPVFEHHRATCGDHREFGYKDFIDRFSAEKFSAVDWAVLFRQSGARFVMPVAEHHDGFAKYDTQPNESFRKGSAVLDVERCCRFPA